MFWFAFLKASLQTFTQLVTHSVHTVSAGCEVPDDRNMLNEQMWSPDRPKFRGQRLRGIQRYIVKHITFRNSV